MTSKAQIIANRKNAKLGWVKSNEWKAVSRENALKHWITSRKVMSDADNLIFLDIYEALKKEHVPFWYMENFLVEQMAFCILRLRKMRAYEEAYHSYMLTPYQDGARSYTISEAELCE